MHEFAWIHSDVESNRAKYEILVESVGNVTSPTESAQNWFAWTITMSRRCSICQLESIIAQQLR